jgi:hypothetical protein
MLRVKLQTSWHFRTIGLGTINYRAASKRLAREAESTGLFKSCIGYNENYLKDFSPEFWNDHKKVLKARTPGFGWYIWKPEFIRVSLANIPPGHGLMYCDAGNYISTTSSDLELLSTYLNLATEHNIVASNSQDFIEERYSSADLMNLLSLDAKSRKTNQYMAGFLLIVNSKEGRKFANSWAAIACAENHKYLLPENHSTQISGFDTHRHDQAILSCLLKSYSKPPVVIGNKIDDGCIRAVRHRFGHRFKNPNFTALVFYKTLAFFSKSKLALEHRIIKNSLYLRPTNHRNYREI